MEYIAVLSPLLGAMITGFLGKQIGHRGVNIITCAFMTVAALASLTLFADVALGGNVRTVPLFTWISVADLKISWALRFDQLAAVMVMVVNLISCAVHYYSVGYMSKDNARERFMAYLSLFTFTMLMLVTSDNLVQMFFGWEGVGLSSYLLIGFWNHKNSANAAAMKAFVVNRIGDFGLALGIFAIFAVFGTLDFDSIFAAAESMGGVVVPFLGFNIHAISLICGLLFFGAMGKSAQLGLHVWLPDAMEGPTPVSALIHAATMVTAGIFLVARMSPLFEYAPDVRVFMTVIGALTALVGATIAVTQFDIKRVIAYSTMSQLGYMFFALGVSAYSAAMFHLFTHAFFKALLFLGAGSVIHAMSDEQDMRKMGGIWKLIPTTYMMMWIGSLALAGIPLLSGYYSKDLILEAAFASTAPWSAFAFWCGSVAALLTAIYSWRLIFMTFHGPQHADERVMAHVHESPTIMTAPLSFLAAGAIMAGWWGYDIFVGEFRDKFWGDSLSVMMANDSVMKAHHVDTWVKLLPVGLAALGILIAYICYIRVRHMPAIMAATFSLTHNFLFRKWYFDELYERIFIRPILFIGRKLWKTGDVGIIDRWGPDGLAEAITDLARGARKMQTGYIYNYAFSMLIGLVFFLSIYFMSVVR